MTQRGPWIRFGLPPMVEAGTASDSPAGWLSRMRCLEQIWNIAEIGVNGLTYFAFAAREHFENTSTALGNYRQ